MSPDTEGARFEHWFWDDAEVPQGGLAVPGGSVSVGALHVLDINYDQTNLSAEEAGPGFHWVRFVAADVFGRAAEAKYLLQTPATAMTPKPIAESPQGWRRPDPLDDPLRDRAARAPLDMSRAALARSISTALQDGSATIRTAEALAILNLLHSPPR